MPQNFFAIETMFPYSVPQCSFSLAPSPPGPAPPTPTGYFSPSPSFSPSSNSSQDVFLDPSGSIPFSLNLRSPGSTSQLRGRNLKDYEQQLEQLKKENFDLKLRIYLLEERFSHKRLKGDKEDLYKANLDLKVETEALKKQLCDKQELVRQAAALINSLENQFKGQLEEVHQNHAKESEELQEKILSLQKELDGLKDRTKKDSPGDLTLLCDLAFSSPGKEANLMDSANSAVNGLNPSWPIIGAISLQDPLPSVSAANDPHRHSQEKRDVIPEAARNRISELEDEVLRLTSHIQTLEEDIKEKERKTEALHEDIGNLKKEIEDREEKLSDMEQEIIEKDQKVDHLMQDLETRHSEIAAKESTIQTLNEDLHKVEPQIEVKVQEIIEKDRIIEAKTDQLQQQNRILVEIQITLDEKQKQIADLEESLSAAKKETENINKQLSVSLNTIKDMSEHIMSRDKQILHLKKDLKKEDRKVRDLVAELKETMDMLKKAKWEAESYGGGGGGQDSVKEMEEEESERLWAELEQRKHEIQNLQSQNESLLKEAQESEHELQMQKEEAEQKILRLQQQLEELKNMEKSNRDRDPELTSLLSKLESRDNLLRSHEVLIETLRTELRNAKIQLADRKFELKEAKKELNKKYLDMRHFFTTELYGRKKEIGDLYDKLYNNFGTKDSPLDALKLLIDTYQQTNNTPNTVVSQTQPKSSSLPKLNEDAITAANHKEENSSRPNKSGRSNSFSSLENSLYAHMGQKMYNTNQTFNTYILPNENAGQGQAETCEDMISSISSEMQHGDPNVCVISEENFTSLENVIAKGVDEIDVDEGKSVIKTVEVNKSEDNQLALSLRQEIGRFREEVLALKNDRLLLKEQLSALSSIIQTPFDNRDYLVSQKEEYTELRNNKELLSEENEMKSVEKDLDGNKQRCSLTALYPASRYRDVLKNYKQEIISLRKRLADSHNACDLLRNRLEEIVDFMEQILDMERRGIINLSHMSSHQRSQLQKSLDDSRALSHSLSHSLMIGMESALEDALSERESLLSNNFSDVDNTQFEVSFREADNTVDCDIASVLNDYYAGITKISSEIDRRIERMDAFTDKLVCISSQLDKPGSRMDQKKYSATDNLRVKDYAVPNYHCKCSQSSLESAVYIADDFDFGSRTTNHQQTPIVTLSDKRSPGRILHSRSEEMGMNSDDLPPPPFSFTSEEEKTLHEEILNHPVNIPLTLPKHLDIEIDKRGLYSSSFVKSLPNLNLPFQELPQSSLPPNFNLVSPSESEAWSEPDRNVSLARIGLDSCNLLSTFQHDRPSSRSRNTRSSPFTSESDGESKSQEGSEGQSTPLSNKNNKKSTVDALEIKRLGSKIRNLEDLNESLKAELNIYQTLGKQVEWTNNHSPGMVQNDRVTSHSPRNPDYKTQLTTETIGVTEENTTVISASLLQEIHHLRMKLEEAIKNNDLLRDHLVGALSGHMTEESRAFTRRLSSIQKELEASQQELAVSIATKEKYKTQLKDNESKMYELGTRLGDYMTNNQSLEKKIGLLNKELKESKKKLHQSEGELKEVLSLNKDSEVDVKKMSYSSSLNKNPEPNLLQMEVNLLKQTLREKYTEVEKQEKYILSLEEIKSDYEVKLSEQDDAIKKLCQSITTYQEDTSSSSLNGQIVLKLTEALQRSEGRLLQATKERFSLVGEKTRLQSQLASLTMQNELLERDLKELSSDQTTIVDQRILEVQEHKEAKKTIKKLEDQRQLMGAEVSKLLNKIEQLEGDTSTLRTQLDQLSQETRNSTTEIKELASLKVKYKELKEKHTVLHSTHSTTVFDKNSFETKSKELRQKQMEVGKLTKKLTECGNLNEDLELQLKSERCLTENLEMQIQILQSKSLHRNVPSLTRESGSAATNIATPIRPLEKSFQSKSERISSSRTDNKENQSPLSLDFKELISPHALSDAFSGDSPDLGIEGSDGLFSSIEFTANPRKRTDERRRSQKIQVHEITTPSCSDPNHDRLSSELENLRHDHVAVVNKLASTEIDLQEALKQLSTANQKKESVESAIRKQLTKTHQVLKQTKANLQNSKSFGINRQPHSRQNPS